MFSAYEKSRTFRLYTIGQAVSWTILMFAVAWIKLEWFKNREGAFAGIFGGVWLAGLAGVYTTAKILKKHFEETDLALAEAGSRMSETLHNVQLIALLLDKNGNVVFCNHFLLGLIGWEREELLGRNWFDICLPRESSAESRTLFNRQISAGEIPAVYENEIVTRDGKRRFVRWNNALLRNARGEITGASSIGEDVTERLRAQQALREHETLLMQAQQVANIGYYQLDVKSGIWESSDILDKIFGIDKNYQRDIAGWANIIHPDERAAVTAYFANEVVAARKNFDREYRIVRVKDGETRWVHGLGNLYLNEQGEPVRMIGTIQDVTAKKRAEEALSKSEALYHSLVETSQDLIWECDAEGRYSYLNPAWERAFGYRVEEMLGRKFAEFEGPEAAEHDQQAFASVLQGSTIKGHETVHIGKAGNKIHLVFNAKALRDDHDKIIGALGTAYDITERKRIENERRASEDQYRMLFEQMLDGFSLHEVICDENGQPADYRFLAVNSAFEKNIGLPAADIVGKTVTEIMPAIKKHSIERYGKVALTGKPERFEEYSAALNSHYEIRAFSPEPGKFAVISHDISERKRSENVMLARMRLVEVASKHSLDQFVQTILDESEALTGSSIGFYHFLEADQRTLVLQNWSTRTLKEFCSAEGKGRHYDLDLAGVWADCIREKKPVIHNDYPALPVEFRKGLPEGHAEVKRELVVPVLRGDKVVAILGIGNKPTEYVQSDIDVVQQFADLAMEIVERKREEEEKIKARQNYENLLQSIDGIVWEADAQTFAFSFVSQQAEKILGYAPERWLKEANFWAEHIHPEDREHALNYCVGQTQKGQAHEFEYRMIAADGSAIWLRDIVSVIFENNRPAKLRGVMIDITEKKKSEEKLRQLSLAVEQNPASIVITDLSGRIEYVNPKFSQASGYAREEIIGHSPRILKSGKTSPEEYKNLWETITAGEVWRGEFQNKKKNGELYWEDARISPIKNGSGKVTHYVAVKEDITQRKLVEDEAREKTRELESLFRISSHLRTAQSADDMIPLVLEQMTQTLSADTNALILLDEDRQHFTYKLGDGALAQNTGVQFDVKDSISGYVMNTLQPYVTLDFENDPLRTRALLLSEGIGPAILVPLQSETEFIGVLLCARLKTSPLGPFTPAEEKLLAAVGEMVGNALRRAKLYDDALARMHRVQALRSIDAAINANMDSLITLRILVNQILSMMKVDAAQVLLYNSITQTLEYAVTHGLKQTQVRNAQMKLSRGYANTVIIDRHMVKIPDLKQAEDPAYKELAHKEGFASCYIVPMIAKGQTCGMLEVYSRNPFVPNQEWLDFLEALGGQAAIAINNAQLFTNLQKSNLELALAYDATIEGWSKALELKDRETEGHTLRVTDWTIELAKMAGLREAEITHVKRGALLHDIGKMGIPDHILKKAGELTPAEWKIMRQHPEHAYNMIYPIAFLRPAIDIPYCHHERWDGTGYPRKLKSEQIPFVARLFAVIDVWDAITSNRPYRKAWSFEKAFEHIQAGSGKHFDPQVVALFTKEIERFRRTDES